MHVTVVVPRALRRFSGDQSRVEVRLQTGATVAQVLDALADRHPGIVDRTLDDAGSVRRHVNVFVDGDNVRDLGGLATPVRDRSEVVILPAVSGG